MTATDVYNRSIEEKYIVETRYLFYDFETIINWTNKNIM